MLENGQNIPVRELEGKSGFKVWALNQNTLKLEAMPVSRDALPECQVLTKPYGLAQLSEALTKLLPEALAAAG